MIRQKLALALLVLAPAAAFADCATPVPLTSNTNVPATSTCGGTRGINMGGTVYPFSSVVYSFTKGAGATSIGLAGTDREMSLVTSCLNSGSGPAPLAVAAAGGSLDISGIANGNYVLVVSTDPSLVPAVAGDDICGNESLTVGTLPVALQKFEVN